MDAIVGLLSGVRARGAFLLRSVLDPPWALRIEDRAPLSLLAVVDGQGWVIADGEAAIRMAAGDVAIVRGPDHYVVADDPSSVPSVVIHPGQRCTTLGGADLALTMRLGVRTWGNSDHGATVLLTGTYQGDREMGNRLLLALPAVVVVRATTWDSPLVRLLSQEIVKDEPGQEVVLDRLLDLLLIAVLRTWFTRPAPMPRRGGRRTPIR